MSNQGCTCAPSARAWQPDGRCASCGQTVLESQLAPVLLQILCGGTGLVLFRNNIGFDDQRHIHYGVGGKGGADYLGLFAGRFVGVEMKSRTGRQTTDQRAFEALVLRTGGVYALVRNETDAHKLLAYLRSLPS